MAEGARLGEGAAGWRSGGRGPKTSEVGRANALPTSEISSRIRPRRLQSLGLRKPGAVSRKRTAGTGHWCICRTQGPPSQTSARSSLPASSKPSSPSLLRNEPSSCSPLSRSCCEDVYVRSARPGKPPPKYRPGSHTGDRSPLRGHYNKMAAKCQPLLAQGSLTTALAFPGA